MKSSRGVTEDKSAAAVESQTQTVVTDKDDASSNDPTEGQRKWLERGLNQPGGKLPLFDDLGQKVNERTVTSCVKKGWAEQWFNNSLKPNWIVCKLTEAGRKAVESG